MRPLWSRVLGVAQVLGGIGLMGWTVLFFGFMIWGGDFFSLQSQVLYVLPWLAPLAIGPILAARRSAEGRRRLARVGAACAAGALAAVLSVLFDAMRCTMSELVPWPLLLLLIPLRVAQLFLGFVTLAIPALAARSRVGRAAGWAPLGLGFAITVYPEGCFANEPLGEWFLVTIAMLVSLGVALVAVGIDTLRARSL